MYRFGARENFIKRTGGIYAQVLLFIAVFFFFLYAINFVSTDTLDREEESLKRALDRDIVSCYCVEGTYPPSLDYIKEHYGLTYDEDNFFVDYQSIGSNIYPDVTVIRREEE